MKLRLTSNSVRFRITPTELKILRETGKIESCTLFGPTSGERLKILIEKDFRCIETLTGEGESDRFANPAVCTPVEDRT